VTTRTEGKKTLHMPTNVQHMFKLLPYSGKHRRYVRASEILKLQAWNITFVTNGTLHLSNALIRSVVTYINQTKFAPKYQWGLSLKWPIIWGIYYGKSVK